MYQSLHLFPDLIFQGISYLLSESLLIRGILTAFFDTYPSYLEKEYKFLVLKNDIKDVYKNSLMTW